MVSAREWAASASIAADPLIRPPANFVTATNTFAARAISTVLRLACAVRRERTTLRELVQVSGMFWPLVTTVSYPSALIDTRGRTAGAGRRAPCVRYLGYIAATSPRST